MSSPMALVDFFMSEVMNLAVNILIAILGGIYVLFLACLIVVVFTCEGWMKIFGREF